ncbi:MAG: phosphotransferase [Alloprevotella sp.]|nr:phosphotransferase [Alloprevotella sp.]
MQPLRELYRNAFGTEPERIEKMAGAGSNRQYYLLQGRQAAVGTVGTSRHENECFLYLARHFHTLELPVPRVYAVSDDGLCYLQQYVGGSSLHDALRHARESGGRYEQHDHELIERVIRYLPHFQVRGAEGLDRARLLPPATFDRRAAMFDLNYFKYCFLRTTDTEYDECALQDDMDKLAEDLTQYGPQGFLYRDFQARNVMLDGGAPCFIDFQGGKTGPLQYDLAAFLWQASARYPQELRDAMVAAYLDELDGLADVDHETFRRDLRLMVLFRQLQVLGAYGLRGHFERKKHFLDSIPPALDSLRETLDTGVCAPYPALLRTLRRMLEKPAAARATQDAGQADGQLTVRVFSFSYKKGIPADESGNGGGYVFDCRAPHNPGRYDAYKTLTGLDEPVVRFLEEGGEVQPFLESIYKMADFHVQRYMERGFTDLMFSFGCTGGQHRSVYCAQHLAEHLSGKFGITVLLEHREQGIRQTFPRREAPPAAPAQ